MNQVIQEETNRARVASDLPAAYTGPFQRTRISCGGKPFPYPTTLTARPFLSAGAANSNRRQGHNAAGDFAGKGTRARCADGRSGDEERAGPVPGAPPTSSRVSRTLWCSGGWLPTLPPAPLIVIPRPGGLWAPGGSGKSAADRRRRGSWDRHPLPPSVIGPSLPPGAPSQGPEG